MKEIKAAIVTTLCDADDIIESYVNYHLSIGFDHMFLFFDNPNDSSISKVENNKNVTVIRNDWELHIEWSKTKIFKLNPDQRRFINNEVMARQLLNVAVAIERCKEQKIDWLLHIDCDELFYSPNISVKNHFKSLIEKGISNILYSNYEAVPEKVDIINGFKEVTLFKKNRHHLNGEQNKIKDNFSIHANPVEKRTEPIADFIAYEVGKSAAQLNKRLFSIDVFYFSSFPGFIQMRFLFIKHFIGAFFNKLISEKSKNQPSEKVENGIRRLPIDPTLVNKDVFPIILHYPSCGFEAFWQKYQTLGAFNDQWFDNKEADIKSAIPFHIEARDVVMKNDTTIAREFYKETVVINEPEFAKMLLDKGIFCRIHEPANMLN